MKARSNEIVSVIVVTCGMHDYLKPCLDSIREQTYPLIEVILVDNSLNPHFSQAISKANPGVKLYSSPKNIFYCRALNKGIEISQGDFILCLNDDVILDKRFLEEALKGFSINGRIGMVSGKILRWDKQTIDSTGLFISLWRTAKEKGYGVKDKGQYNREGYIFGVNGAVAFYRREMLEDVQENHEYFDSGFHFFYEDLDIAWRAKNQGWKGYYIPGALAYHVRGASVRQGKGINQRFARRYISDELQVDLIKNRYLAIIKNESWLGFLAHLPFIVLYEILLWGFILFLRPRLIKKFILALGYLNSALRKRVAPCALPHP
jgi:GT2 family glycosyltransferase